MRACGLNPVMRAWRPKPCHACMWPKPCTLSCSTQASLVLRAGSGRPLWAAASSKRRGQGGEREQWSVAVAEAVGAPLSVGAGAEGGWGGPVAPA